MGSSERLEEFRKIISEKDFLVTALYDEGKTNLNEFDLIADLNLDEFPERVHLYKNLSGKLVIGCAVKKSLAEITTGIQQEMKCFLAGINSLPGFISRNVMEVSFLNSKTKEEFVLVCKHLDWNWKEVKDSIGMVTPRVLSMIVNEACFALDEGTASREDIDKGMKLGTAYPFGPLEWADRIGIKNIYEVLLAIQNTNNDARYEISPLMKSMSEQKKTFYP